MSFSDLYYVQTNLTSLLILVIIALRIQHQHPSGRLSTDLFVGMLLANTVLVFLEMVLNLTIEHPGFVGREVILVLSTVFYLFNPAVSAIYAAFVLNWVKGKEALTKRVWGAIAFPYAIFAVLVILSVWNGYLFRVDAIGLYSRGDGFWILVLTSYGYFLAALSIVVVRWNHLRYAERKALLVFGILPFVGGLIQTFYYGTAVVWNMVTLALLIIYVDILSGNLDTDALTGLANRRKLAPVLKSYRKEYPEKFLGGIMIDVNAFKAINDTYGHKIGDEVLLEVADTLNRSVYRTDHVFRLGGDEFLILTVLSKSDQLSSVMEKIAENLTYANQRLSVEFTVSLSCGINVWPLRKLPTMIDLVSDLDAKMYEEKRKFHATNQKSAAI
jgi:diguanylate cyclase (GGDEF)-like protein